MLQDKTISIRQTVDEFGLRLNSVKFFFGFLLKVVFRFVCHFVYYKIVIITWNMHIVLYIRFVNVRPIISHKKLARMHLNGCGYLVVWFSVPMCVCVCMFLYKSSLLEHRLFGSFHRNNGETQTCGYLVCTLSMWFGFFFSYSRVRSHSISVFTFLSLSLCFTSTHLH